MALRDILTDPRRKVTLRDSSRHKAVELRAPALGGKERVSESFEVPGYPGANAKLVIARAGTPFEREPGRFRLGGILVKSRHAIHESTYFDPDLESNPHALWFYGRLVCPYIDDLWNDFDNRFEAGVPPEPNNPVPILDPSRQTGLTRGHPFVTALFREALKRLRPLVEEERQREERQRAAIESDATRKRLNALEKAAAKFMQEFGEEEETARDPDNTQVGSHFTTRGYVLSPPFAQMVREHSQRFTLAVSQEVFPEFEAGANVQIECVTPEITSDRRFVGLQPHPQQDGVLRAVWNVKALQATAELQAAPSPGAGLKIQLEDIDLKHQRSRWRQNVLEIAARHASVARYLGSKASGFAGQETKHFRLLVAEVVADAICYKLLAQNIQANREDYEHADWDQYYADYSKYMSQFLPVAHKLQCPEGT